MIRFDPSLLSVEIVQLKSVTTALGGSISVLDPKRTTATKEVMSRIIVPTAIARSFIQKTMKVTKYLKPVYTAIVRYGDHVIAMERHPLAGLGVLEEETENGTRRWVPEVQRNLDSVVHPQFRAGARDWYFDGRYMYMFRTDNVSNEIERGEFLTADGRFRRVEVTSIDLQHLDNKDKLLTEIRSCMAFLTSSGISAVCPPIWKDLMSVGLGRLGVGKDDDDESVTILGETTTKIGDQYLFDRFDQMLSVNLNFVLKAGAEIGNTFGYEFVEPLQLPRLMIELRTVNLPNVPLAVKSTYNSGLTFTHAIAWLLGMSRKANTLETLITMRSLMKYLTKRGTFKRNAFDPAVVFKAGKTIDDIKQLDITRIDTDEEFGVMREFKTKGKLFEESNELLDELTDEIDPEVDDPDSLSM